MNKKGITALVLISIVLIVFGSMSSLVSAAPANNPPIPLAGFSQVVNTKVTLDGTASHDPDNNLSLTYAWSIYSAPAGSTATLSSTTEAKPTFTPDKTGDYLFTFIVTDSLGLKSASESTVKITATPLIPTSITFVTTSNTVNVGDSSPSPGSSPNQTAALPSKA